MGTHHIVEAYTPALKKDLPGEPIDKGKPELEHKQEGWEAMGDGGGGSVGQSWYNIQLNS